jgi:hypothetical protein
MSLRSWFILHFIVDFAFAIPLFLFPVQFMAFFGWESIDSITARLVAAALFAIGYESWAQRDASAEIYQQMLRLKVLWSLMATLGIAFSIIQGNHFWGAWVILIIFSLFHIVWRYWQKVAK